MLKERPEAARYTACLRAATMNRAVLEFAFGLASLTTSTTDGPETPWPR